MFVYGSLSAWFRNVLGEVVILLELACAEVCGSCYSPYLFLSHLGFLLFLSRRSHTSHADTKLLSSCLSSCSDVVYLELSPRCACDLSFASGYFVKRLLLPAEIRRGCDALEMVRIALVFTRGALEWSFCELCGSSFVSLLSRVLDDLHLG